MESSVLQYDAAAGTGVLRFSRAPHAGESWLFELAVCADPYCGCPNVELHCVPEKSAAESSDWCYRFWLDVEKRELFHGGDPRPSPEFLAFGAEVAAELQEPDWQVLSDHMREAKDRKMREAQAREDKFPDEVLAGDVSMVGYAEIFPRAEGFEFQFESDEWLADDQYCVNPECRCREALLSFIRLSRREPPEGMPEAPPAFYDYKRAGFDPEYEPDGQPALAALVRAVR